ncbi:MAG TPA: hypothetical protein VLH09_06060 [Bryobacteraceae bacterium]|nr:hypothetical protein [Bryobacteraceae bacterium]
MHLWGQQPSFRLETVHGRQAYVIENGKMRVSALRGGGHIAEIRLVTKDARLGVNPLYVPKYQTIEPYQFDEAKHGDFYGRGGGRYLDAGYLGHLLCFPSFGPASSQEEIRNGLGSHGEAVTVEWKQPRPPQIDAGGVTLYYAAELPHTQYRVERAIRLPAGATVAHVEEWFENLVAYDRPYNRNQHVTLGAPFVALDKNMLDVSGTESVTKRRGATEPPQLDDPSMDRRTFNMAPKSSLFRTFLVDKSRQTGYFTVYSTEFPILLGYVFPAAEHPWVIDWQENGSGQATPRLGQMVARGIEFGTSPLDEGLRRSVERRSFLGTPTYQWINGRQRVKAAYTIFLAEIPAGFAGVADIRIEPGQIVVIERGSARQIRVPSEGRP